MSGGDHAETRIHTANASLIKLIFAVSLCVNNQQTVIETFLSSHHRTISYDPLAYTLYTRRVRCVFFSTKARCTCKLKVCLFVLVKVNVPFTRASNRAAQNKRVPSKRLISSSSASRCYNMRGRIVSKTHEGEKG